MTGLLGPLLVVALILVVPATLGIFARPRRRPAIGTWARGTLGAGMVALAALGLSALLGSSPWAGLVIALVLGGVVLANTAVAAAWHLRGLWAWSLTSAAGAAYLLYVAHWMVTTPRGIAGDAGGWLLWLLELFVYVLALGYVWELVDVLCRWDWRRRADVDAEITHPEAHRGAPRFVSLHVPTHDEPPDLVIETLRHLQALDHPGFEVLVLDNNTTDPVLWRPVEDYCRGERPDTLTGGREDPGAARADLGAATFAPHGRIHRAGATARGHRSPELGADAHGRPHVDAHVHARLRDGRRAETDAHPDAGLAADPDGQPDRGRQAHSGSNADAGGHPDPEVEADPGGQPHSQATTHQHRQADDEADPRGPPGQLTCGGIGAPAELPVRSGTDRRNLPPAALPRMGRMPESITREQVRHLADLARIDLDDEELDHLAPQLAVILDSIASISEVAAEDIPPTSHPLPLTNVFRDDVVQPSLSAEEALSGAPASEQQRFEVPRILGDEQ